MNASSFSWLGLDSFLTHALLEDLGSGDLTTEACIDENARSVAVGNARKAMIVCGTPVAERVFKLVDATLHFESHLPDGAQAVPGAKLWTVRGASRSILMGERVALNCVQRMGGIATLTQTYVAALAGGKTRITDTRKTTPGMRYLERYAVRMGGGHNHRDNLGAAVLIKDNHIAACGGITTAIARARARAPHTSKVECEVDSIKGLEEALDAGADIIMLDNFDDDTIVKALAIAKGRAFIEVSGGITLPRIATLSAMGVDAISVGALTHSASSVDIGLDFS
jgi:nicotinate-nucleotide pyrophosphorylase (carboxylating)